MCKTGSKTFHFETFLFCGFEEFIIVLSDNKDWRIYQVGFFYCGLEEGGVGVNENRNFVEQIKGGNFIVSEINFKNTSRLHSSKIINSILKFPENKSQIRIKFD
jgi:hypothetical protein